jgi:hypothetical protein
MRPKPDPKPLHQSLSASAKAAVLRDVPAIEALLACILSAVDDSSQPCPCCKLTVRRAYRDHQLAENLRSTLSMLRRWYAESRPAS